MSTGSANETEAHREAVANQVALDHQLFGLLVKEEWYSLLAIALRYPEPELSGAAEAYLNEPEFRRGDLFLGCWDAREYMSRALGRPVGDSEFVALVTHALKEELDKYGIQLRLVTRHNYDGTDQVLRIYARA